jgi:hypothetical protein
MVQINSQNKRRTKLFFGIKPRTIFTVTIGLAVLILFSAEPVIYDPHSRHELMVRHIPRRVPSIKSPSTTTRYGMVQRQSLRINVLHEVDRLWEATSHQIQQVPTTNVRSYPRVILLDDVRGDFSRGPSNSTGSIKQGKRQVPSMGHSSCCDQEPDYYVHDFERPFLDDCEPRVQPNVHPTCNNLHELTLESDISLLSTTGSWRTAWKVDVEHPVVLKMLHWSRHFDHQAYDQHALDVIVMDELTASPYVIDAYGFCGQSVVTEWAPSGGRDYVKSYDIRSRQRLRIARDLARGLADLQALRHLGDYQSSPAHGAPTLVFAHNDINIANTIQMDGKLKWNDFNIGVLLRTSKESHSNSTTEMCDAPVRFKADLWRSPEEIRNTTYVRLDQTDVYGFGNILYQVMSRHQPWTHKEPEGKLNLDQIADRKREGGFPTIPEQYKNTTKPELQALLLATVSCYHPNPNKRLTAYELAHALSKVYDILQRKKKVTPVLLRDLFVR